MELKALSSKEPSREDKSSSRPVDNMSVDRETHQPPSPKGNVIVSNYCCVLHYTALAFHTEGSSMEPSSVGSRYDFCKYEGFIQERGSQQNTK